MGASVLWGSMFVRKKRNASGSTTIQVIDKNNGFRIVKTFGTSQEPEKIERLFQQGKLWMEQQSPQLPLLPTQQNGRAAVDLFVSQLSNASVRTLGPELIFGTLFDELGFDKIAERLFRHIVIARLAYPTSKLKTVDYLRRYEGIDIEVDSIYRFLDKLNKTHKDVAERIAYEHTKTVLGEEISVVFYDMTTLYFEAEDEDDLRKIGFSKDGKFQHPQIMLGLLVGRSGFPISYDIFEGNTFEGHTIVPILKKIEAKFGFSNITVIADAAMLSKSNIALLGKAKYRFIVGGRIKNESQEIQDLIIEHLPKLIQGVPLDIKRADGTRLVVTWSEKRSKKDAHNRDKGVARIKKRVGTGKLTKEHINNRGYNKFLTLSGNATVGLDEAKIAEDARWDGLKGYITNTDLTPDFIVDNYRELWQIEKAFRISKTDLRIRPIFHFRKRRIEAHICIAFVAYSIYKELERRLLESGSQLSLKRASDLTHTMYALNCLLPGDALPKQIMLNMDDEQRSLYDLIHPV